VDQDQENCHLVLTTGGTGSHAGGRYQGNVQLWQTEMRQIRLQFVPTVTLSRQVA